MLGVTEKCPGSNLLLRWIRQPVVLRDMGRGIVVELNQRNIVPGRDYGKDMRSLRVRLGWSKKKKAERKGRGTGK